MRRPILVLAIAALLLVRVPAHAQGPGARRFSDVQEVVLRSLGEYFESLRLQAGIPGLTATVIGPDDVIWEQAFGRQDNERFIATRTDTPFELDGLTEVFTTALVLRCVEEGSVSLDDRISRFKPEAAEPDATIRQILTHTSGSPDGLVYSYRPERLDWFARVIRSCTDGSFRETLANLLERLAMVDSVPGLDIIHPDLLTEGIPSPAAVERYQGVLKRLATPYATTLKGQASPSQYQAPTIKPSGGLISTVRDVAQFDLALKKGVLLRPETLAEIRSAPLGANGQRLPHGLGWFVQTYNGETILWQFGVSANASSSLLVSVPGRGITLVLLANSDGLVKPFALSAGNVTASPFVRLFLSVLVR